MVGIDLVIQSLLLLLALGLVYAMHTIPTQALATFKRRGRAQSQAKRHFLQGAQLLARSRSAPTRSTAISLAKQATAEANKALSLDPRDAAPHILKSLSLQLLGHPSAALRALEPALLSPAVKTLTDPEHGDALFKRAELQLAASPGNRRSRLVDSAISDLSAAVRLSPGNCRAFCLLGSCYERKEMRVEAKKAYEEAVRVDPEWKAGREGLERVG